MGENKSSGLRDGVVALLGSIWALVTGSIGAANKILHRSKLQVVALAGILVLLMPVDAVATKGRYIVMLALGYMAAEGLADAVRAYRSK
jgi:hypothetical protein